MFKDDLKQAMKNDHASAQGLAEYLNVKESSIKQWIYGQSRPGQRDFRMICELYNLPIERYVEERSNMKNGKFPWDAEKLIKLMADRGKSIEDVAKATGKQKVTVYGWRSGKRPSREAVEKMANLFDVEPEYFSKNVVGEFKPKPYVRPEVKGKVNLSEKPYKAAPIVNTITVDAPEEDLKDKIDYMAVDYNFYMQVQILKDQIDDLNKTNEVMAKALNDLRKLVVEYLIKDEEPKKSWWQRVFG